MATGSQSDIANRLAQVLPPSWFQSGLTNEPALLQGVGNIMAWVYSLISFAKLQTRISTATGFFLDLMALDFFGRNYGRSVGMTDAVFATGIKKELLRPRGTRAALAQALTDLTGRAPKIFVPSNAPDTGGYHYACGYSLAGGYGSLLMPFQSLVVAYRPSTSGVPFIPGYGTITTAGGYSIGGYSTTGEYSDISYIVGPVTDAQIFARVASVAPIGTIPWTRLSS